MSERTLTNSNGDRRWRWWQLWQAVLSLLVQWLKRMWGNNNYNTNKYKHRQLHCGVVAVRMCEKTTTITTTTMKQTCKELMKQRITSYKWAAKRNDICTYALEYSRASKRMHLSTHIGTLIHIHLLICLLCCCLMSDYCWQFVTLFNDSFVCLFADHFVVTCVWVFDFACLLASYDISLICLC